MSSLDADAGLGQHILQMEDMRAHDLQPSTSQPEFEPDDSEVR